MAASERKPDALDVFRRLLSRAVEDLCVACPATVQSYDPATQLVTVRPDLKRTHEDEEGNEIVESLPVISNVPVCFPGGGGFACSFPLVKGDSVLLVFSDRSLDRWISDGGEVDPVLLHSHGLTDAIAIPGVRHLKNALQNAATDRLRLGKDGGATVEITTSDVILNGGTASVGRVGDSVQVTIPANALTLTVSGSMATGPAAPLSVPGTITSGAPHVKG